MKTVKYLLILAAAISVASCTKELQAPEENSSSNGSYATATGEIEKGWVNIKLHSNAQALSEGVITRGAVNTGNAELDQLAESIGAIEIVRIFPDGGKFAAKQRKHGLHLWYAIRFDEDMSVTRASSDISKISGVEWVEPVYKIQPANGFQGSIPADMVYMQSNPMAGEQTGFNDPRLGDQWHYGRVGAKPFADINLFEAWTIETGNPKVIVSVHDEGIDIEHPDLKEHIFTNTKEIPDNGIDDDDNGKVDDIHGWSFVNNSGNIPAKLHGTHVAGTISAVNNNGIGVCGVAGGAGPGEPGVTILPCHTTERVVIPTMAESYVYAANMGAVISQNSWTLGVFGELPKVYSDAFDYFIEEAGTDENGIQTGPMKGGIIIFASGNAGAGTMLPALDDRVVSVGATNTSARRAEYSSGGPDIEISAPGGNGANASPSQLILSTGAGAQSYIPNSYSAIWGTSMASPHVAGVVALIVSKFGLNESGAIKPGFTAAECRERLLNGYRPLGDNMLSGDLSRVGVGICDAAIALKDDPKAAPDALADAEIKIERNSLLLSWKVSADRLGNPIAKTIISYVGKRNGAEDITKTETVKSPYNVGSQVSDYAITVPYNRSYEIKIVAVDRYGNNSSEVKLSAVLGDFPNKAPVQRRPIADVSIASTGDAAVVIELLDYITDPNLADGDVLSFEAESYTPSVVKVEIVNANQLKITPLSKGEARISVKATDLAGASYNTSFKITVLSGGTIPGPDPDPTPSTGASVSVYPNPAVSNLSINIADIQDGNATVAVYDSLSRKVVEQSVVFASGVGSIDVSKLTSGMYGLMVTENGNSYKTTFIKK